MSSEAAVAYATLILSDADIQVSSEKILALTKAAGIEVQAIWAEIFAKAIEGKDLKEVLFNIGAGSAAPAAGAAAASGSASAEAAVEEVEEAAEESDDDMGFGLFD
ncbi:ribosomal protein 60S [Nadsonia fulvescens var. elongata DSM 6958]|uniref:Ribosomal protein 60S n=1 Tax=Nadsonia fulvescens var. elongata DSM 6958 TaxID=857566 RepID=A0A1E3PGQ7_9ASCO|nr:ribosomal protein 60S [Nadsonia fulvescens var. elongata DSM 6958]